MTDSSSDSNNTFLQKFKKWREALFLVTVGGMSMLFGFGASIAASKKQDPDGFDKGMTYTRRIESGPALAARALKWGTIYAVGGCSILFYTIWKLSGAKSLADFRQKVGEILPNIPKNEPQGRTEFENLTDLFQYLIDEDKRLKADKVKNEPSSAVKESLSAVKES